MLKGIQADDVYEIPVIGESQSVGNQGEVEIVDDRPTRCGRTHASHTSAPGGCAAGRYRILTKPGRCPAAS